MGLIIRWILLKWPLRWLPLLLSKMVSRRQNLLFWNPLLLLIFCNGNDLTTTALIVNGVLAVVITLLDYVAPVWFAKKSGGSKYGTWGTTIGLIVGLFLGLPGILLGPFLGAYIGELIAKTPSDKAFKVAAMSFVAFMLTTGIKAVYGIYVLVVTVSNSWDILFK